MFYTKYNTLHELVQPIFKENITCKIGDFADTIVTT